MASPNRAPLTSLECPNCGKPVNQFNPDSQAVICSACGTHIALGAEKPQILAKGRRLPKPPRPVKIGMKATIAQTDYIVLGRVVYQGTSEGETFTWNEWLMGADDGRMLWLSFDEHGFGLFQKVRFREQFNPRRDRVIKLGDKTGIIRERYSAHIVGAEGELTWQAKPGERLFVAEGTGRGGLRYSIQQTEEELEIYEGRAISELALARAANDQAWLKAIQATKNRKGTLQIVAAMCIAAAILGVFFALIAGLTGEDLPTRVVELSQSAPLETFDVDFPTARPAVIGIKLISGGLPENSYIDVDMEITSPDGTQDYLFAQELWYETGVDEDGPWRESQYSTSEMFVPSQAGTHTLQVSYDGSVLSSLTLEVSIRRNHIMPLWFFIYAAVAGAIGLLALAASAPRATMTLISELMDD